MHYLKGKVWKFILSFPIYPFAFRSYEGKVGIYSEVLPMEFFIQKWFAYTRTRTPHAHQHIPTVQKLFSTFQIWNEFLPVRIYFKSGPLIPEMDDQDVLVCIWCARRIVPDLIALLILIWDDMVVFCCNWRLYVSYLFLVILILVGLGLGLVFVGRF